ncbi:MAG: hypothetical protein VXU42_01095 [Verrucomicrobiota bacterium]|nr:hypothetical protein [Verrucomicrobiota bacterium]
MAAPLDLPSLSLDAIQAQDVAMKGKTLLLEDISSSSLDKTGHVDAVGGAGRSWWWMNVWPWARRQGRGATWR